VSGIERDDEEMKGERGKADGGVDVEVGNEEIEKETSMETGKQREQLWREEKNFNCQGNLKRVYGLYSGHHKVEVVPAVRYRAGNQTAW